MIRINIDEGVINSVYLPLFTQKQRYTVVYGGSGSGKSYALAQLMIYKALKEKRRILVIRKYATTLKDSVFDLVVNTLKNWELYNYTKINLSTYTITLPNGSVLLFKGLDDQEKIKSIYDITDAWIEEATELTEDEFTQIDLRIRSMANNQQIFCSFNPVSKANWVYKKWFAPEAIKNDNTFILRTTYKDNRFLPDEYIKSLEEKQLTNPTYYKIYALGEFCSLDKLVYTNWRLGTVEDKSNFKLAIGLDWGYSNDLTALTIGYIDQENMIFYIDDSWCSTSKTNKEIAEVIKYKGLSKSLIIADSAEPKSIEELKREGIYRIRPSVKGPDSIIHGIQLLQQYKLVVNPNCTEVITELENYSWKKDKKTNEYINEPIDDWNHHLDAIRYSLQCVDTHKLQSMSKGKIGIW